MKSSEPRLHGGTIGCRVAVGARQRPREWTAASSCGCCWPAGAAAVVAACFGTEPPVETPLAGFDSPPDSPWFKDPAPFIRHDKSLEARLENMEGLTTPNHLFFVRNNSASIDLKASDWRLSVEGDAVEEPMELTYDDIKRLPSRTLTSYLECAGNHRAMFDVVKGQKASGTQWMTGGIGNGEWVGVGAAGRVDPGRNPRQRRQRAAGGAGRRFAGGGLPIRPASREGDAPGYAAWPTDSTARPCPRTTAFLCARSSRAGRAARTSSGSGASSRLVGAGVDAQQHDVVLAHRRPVPAGGRVAAAGL